mmetsp:Transcript_52406/g.131740  ORF Transcript_52406/g.131740 Transcript_52406/m.131740 type:complete len:240 (+) Transcript_52406:2-721(+)
MLFSLWDQPSSVDSLFVVLFALNSPQILDKSPVGGRALLASLMMAERSRNRGWVASPMSSKIIASLVVINTPDWRSRSKANIRSSWRWDEVPSARMCTSNPFSTRSRAVCEMQTCASIPKSTAFFLPEFKIAFWDSGWPNMLKHVFSYTLRWLVSISGTVCPNALGYCSVHTTSTSRIFATLTIWFAMKDTELKFWMTGAKRAWMSHNKKRHSRGDKRPGFMFDRLKEGKEGWREEGAG